MMTPALFTFQIILLVLGFSVGYLFLIKAKTQENNLKSIGEILGWVLIVMTIILEILSFTYSITILNDLTQKVYLPINTNTVQPQYLPQQGVPVSTQEGAQVKQITDNNDDHQDDGHAIHDNHDNQEHP